MEKKEDTDAGKGSENKYREKSSEKSGRDRKSPELFSIDSLGADLELSIFAGVCEKEGWALGKKVTRKVFDHAVESFLKGGIDVKRAS